MLLIMVLPRPQLGRQGMFKKIGRDEQTQLGPAEESGRPYARSSGA